MATPTLAEFEFEIGARMARGDFAGACAAAHACRAAWPSQSAGWLLGSFAALCDGKAESALALIEECLAHAPDNAQFLLQQAESLRALGRQEAAILAASKIGRTANADFAALDAAGQFLEKVRAYPQALEMYDRAVKADPRSFWGRAQRAAIHRLLGQFDLAARDYESVLAFEPLHPDALKGLVDLQPQSPERNHLTALQTALADAPPGSGAAAVLHFALAKSHEDLGNHAMSWRHLTEGNRLERAQRDYRAENDRAVVAQIIAGFPEVEVEHPDLTHERPIFIVGLPRTGTTLVERIIGCHSQVHAAGELPALSQAIGSAFNNTPQGLPRDWREYAARTALLDPEVIAREYLALSRPERGDRARFTDKQTTNFFYCALILRAFPHAHIVHVTRQPLAACYAIYRKGFEYGFAFPFAYDLEELGAFYIDYRRLMAHWQRVLPGRILEVAYEDLVTAQEATTRRLLENLELPFEAACLDFHLNPEPTTTTANSLHVRQPLYDSSLQQWRHYAEQLAPLRTQLETAGIRID
jgi:tetratricopeptide (TPR) repeat protein